MPTPVSSARECLTDESARALDDAVNVARRRSHSQTTSLHAVSALLALPSSTLRDACARARSSAYSPRLQFRALELCVGVSLDRLPTSKSADEPPISNSLMAAIKRSQANQRRHPETFHLYQQQLQNQTSSSSISCVKVELKHFILSILDDPIVSRVFGDAGFRSSDIKMAILQPPTISRFPRSRCPPVFLCNLPDPDPNLKFPFGGLPGDENSRRIGEILVKKMGRNPLLIGVSAREAVTRFLEIVQSGRGGILPDEINGKISAVSIEKEIHEFIAGNWNENMIGLRFKEVREAVEGCTGGGIVVNYGELKVFVEGGSCDAVDYVISQLGSLVKVFGEKKLWLIGAVGSYETYMKFSTLFPSIEKEWDMSLLPITSSKSCIGGSPSKTSLMGSFVPFGGFFPSPHELENLSSSTNLSVVRCDLCDEKYEQELSMIVKGGSTVSIGNQESASLASWLTPEPDTSKRMSAIEAKDHGSVLSVKLVELQKKWNDICQRIHHNQSCRQDISQVRSNVPGIDSPLNESRFTKLGPFIPGNFQKILVPRQNSQLAISSEAEDTSSSQQKLPVDFLAHTSTSSSSTASVTTDLGLGTIYACVEKDQEGKVKLQTHEDRLQNFSGSVSAELDGIRKSPPKKMASSSPRSAPELVGHSGEKDFKQLCRALAESVGWQHEAIYSISHAISRCKSGNGKRRGSSHRGDIWLTFLGPDKIGKRKIASALAEIIFGSNDSLIVVDLNSEITFGNSNSIFDSQNSNLNDVKTRGKTVVDYIAEELSRKPRSVVLLENVDKADFLSQNRLSSAIQTGKFQNTHGREISINGMVFVTTSSGEVEENLFAKNVLYTEETVLGAKGLHMQIAVESVAIELRSTSSSNILLTPKKATSNPSSVNKRKLIETNEFEISMPAIKVSRSCFDLNLPVEEMEGDDDCGTSDNDSSSEQVWLEDFLDQVDEKVVFKPFEFDALAENILKEIGRSFQKTIGRDVVLEIGKEVLVQMLASSWLSEKKRSIEEWFSTVLHRGFMEAKQKHCITSQSIVKLLPVEGTLMEEQAPHVCLPGRIILN